MELGNMLFGNMLFGNSRGYYEVPRHKEGSEAFEVQELMVSFLYLVGCDGYGICVDKHPFKNDRGGITTDLFTIRPYYWGEDESEAMLPNFDYNNGELTIDWYKYALRDSYSNKKITYESLQEVLYKCSNYYKELIEQ